MSTSLITHVLNWVSSIPFFLQHLHETIIFEVVVTRQGNETSPGHRQRKEHLNGRIHPHLQLEMIRYINYLIVP